VPIKNVGHFVLRGIVKAELTKAFIGTHCPSVRLSGCVITLNGLTFSRCVGGKFLRGSM